MSSHKRRAVGRAADVAVAAAAAGIPADQLYNEEEVDGDFSPTAFANAHWELPSVDDLEVAAAAAAAALEVLAPGPAALAAYNKARLGQRAGQTAGNSSDEDDSDDSGNDSDDEGSSDSSEEDDSSGEEQVADGEGGCRTGQAQVVEAMQEDGQALPGPASSTDVIGLRDRLLRIHLTVPGVDRDVSLMLMPLQPAKLLQPAGPATGSPQKLSGKRKTRCKGAASAAGTGLGRLAPGSSAGALASAAAAAAATAASEVAVPLGSTGNGSGLQVAHSKADGGALGREAETDSSPMTSSEASSSSTSSEDDADGGSVLDMEEMRQMISKAYAQADLDDDEEGGGGGGGKLGGASEALGLPAVNPLDIEIAAGDAIQPAGLVLSVLDGMVVVQGSENSPALSEGSVLCLGDRQPVGRVEEVFGPVLAPFYALRYAGKSPMPSELVTGAPLFSVAKHSHFVSQEDLYRHGPAVIAEVDPDLDAGSDEEVHFSDDEKEAAYQRKLKSKRKQGDDGGGGGPGAGGGRAGHRPDRPGGRGRGRSSSFQPATSASNSTARHSTDSRGGYGGGGGGRGRGARQEYNSSAGGGSGQGRSTASTTPGNQQQPSTGAWMTPSSSGGGGPRPRPSAPPQHSPKLSPPAHSNAHAPGIPPTHIHSQHVSHGSIGHHPSQPGGQPSPPTHQCQQPAGRGMPPPPQPPPPQIIYLPVAVSGPPGSGGFSHPQGAFHAPHQHQHQQHAQQPPMYIMHPPGTVMQLQPQHMQPPQLQPMHPGLLHPHPSHMSMAHPGQLQLHPGQLQAHPGQLQMHPGGNYSPQGYAPGQVGAPVYMVPYGANGEQPGLPPQYMQQGGRGQPPPPRY